MSPSARHARLVATALLCLFALGLGIVPASAVQSSHPTVVSDNPVNWTPNILDGRVNAVLQMGQKVIVGGTFTQVQRSGTTQTLTRNYLFAFDMTTGAIDPDFVPQLPNVVEALAPGPDGQSVFVGGAFNSVNGNTGVRRLARLSLTDGQIVPGFQANANAAVLALVLRGQWLYAAGRFTSIRNTARSALARLNPVTGVVDANLNLPFSGPQLGGDLRVRKIDVTPDGSRLVAIGNFSQVAGVPRNQIALLDLSTTPATVSSWQTDLTPFVNPANPGQTYCSPSFSTWMRDVDFAPDGQYFVLVTTGAYRANRLCDTVSRWETGAAGPGQQPSWVDWAGGDTFWGVGVTGTAVYAGGHQRWMNNPYRSNNAGPGAVPREGIAALDPVNGLPLSWNPGRERGVGTFDLVGTPDGLWVGSDTSLLAGETRRRIGLFPLAGGAVVPPNVPYSLPNDLYAMPQTDGSLIRRSFNGTTYGPPTVVDTGVDWTTARGAFALNGRLYVGLSDGTLSTRTFAGSSVGPATTVDLHGLNAAPPTSFLIPGTTTPVPAFSTHLAGMTGMFFSNGRIYYTVSGNPRLYYRYFTPESQIVGANLFVASTADGVDWANVRGVTLASGSLFFALANGNLYRVAWSGTAPTGPITQLGGPGMDGVNWASRGLFVFAQTVDTLPPTAPGKPTGVSNGFDSIDLSWQAASDQSLPITYRVYRDGNPTPVGTVQSSSTSTVTFVDTGLVSGSTHTYRVDAVDAVGNVGPMSQASDPITVQSQDTTPPTQPGTPIGSSSSSTTIDLSWSPSSDATPPITYRVYRDGGASPIGSTTNSSFTDTGLAPGSTHTYRVDAVDAVGNVSAMSGASAPITVASALFADGFSSGDFSSWTSVTRLTIDGAQGAPSPPSARGTPASQSAFAYRDLPATQTSACASTRVNVASQGGTGLDLFRLRSAGGAALVKVFVNQNGMLAVRADFSGAQISSGVPLGAGWHLVELCGTVGTSGAWSLYRDGTQIVSSWAANTGTAPIARIQIGDTAKKTWTANWDDVVVDAAPG